jgi:hypothetical protein
MSEKMTKAADEIFEAVNEYLAKRIAVVMQRFDELEARVKELPQPIDGKDGERGEKGESGADGAQGPQGEAGPEGPQGLQGEKGDSGPVGAMGATGATGEKGIEGPVGRDGEPGRDAIHVDVLDAIDVERKYQRGTFASHAGGLVRAFRVTDPIGDGPLEKFGWSVVVKGIADIGIEQGDDKRSFGIACKLTDGSVLVKTFSMPVQIYRGVYKAGVDYEQGDTVTWDGSNWHAEQATKEAPGGASRSWVLITKRGQDGKAGLNGAQGPAGPTGRGGRDLTQMDERGQKY